MSKLPALDSLKQQHKKIQRLYFPKYGDPSLYNNCGRKHYAQSSIFSLPYASFNQNQEYIDFLSKKLNTEDHYQPKSLQYPQLKQPNFQQHQPQNQRNNNFLAKEPNKYLSKISAGYYLDNYQKDNLSSLGNQRQKNTLSRERQFPLYTRVKEEDMRTSRYEKAKMRSKTQAQSQSVQTRLQPVLNRKRTKTQLAEPGQIKNVIKQPRFNPTFLSYINY